MKPTHPKVVLLVLLTIQLLFGINYVVTKVIVDTLPPLVWASFRAVVAAILLVAVAKILKRPHPKFSKEFFKPILLFSVLGVAINQACFLTGLHFTTSTNSSILSTLIPLFTLALIMVRGQEAVTARKASGFVIAFLGVLVLLRIEKFTFSGQSLWGDLLILFNCLNFALFLSLSKKFLMQHDRLWSAAWMFIFGSIGLTLLSIPEWIRFESPELTPILVGCALYALIGGTILTYTLNLWALARTNVSHVALFIYLQPLIAAGLATYFLDEQLTARTFVSAGLIFVGVYVAITTKQTGIRRLFKYRRPKEEPAPSSQKAS